MTSLSEQGSSSNILKVVLIWILQPDLPWKRSMLSWVLLFL